MAHFISVVQASFILGTGSGHDNSDAVFAWFWGSAFVGRIQTFFSDDLLFVNGNLLTFDK